MSNFTKYESREMMIMNEFLNEAEWIAEYVKELKKDNTPFHDLIMTFSDGTQKTIEVKEDEYYWFNKTGNIGIDYISAFRFKNLGLKMEWVSKHNYWVFVEEYNDFFSDIDILKLGKVFTCDADYQLFVVMDNDVVKFAQLYDNKKLKSKNFINYLNRNYNLRINKKIDYNLNDSWESAAYFLDPLKDEMLISCEINQIEDIEYGKL